MKKALPRELTFVIKVVHLIEKEALCSVAVVLATLGIVVVSELGF
jgi:hypothetical protein